MILALMRIKEKYINYQILIINSNRLYLIFVFDSTWNLLYIMKIHIYLLNKYEINKLFKKVGKLIWKNELAFLESLTLMF